MKKIDEKEEQRKELLLSVSIVKDVIERYFHADVEINTKACPCNLCTHTISAGKPAIFVKTFDRKATMLFCDKSCADAHEVLEMEFFGCKQLEKLPAFDGKKKK